MRRPGRTSLFAVLIVCGGCTVVLGPRRESADASSNDLAENDLAEADLTPPPDGYVPGLPIKGQSSIEIMPASVKADGSSNAIITVTVRDAAGVPVVGEPVTITSSGSNNTITPASGITNAMGVFNATLASTRAEQKTATAAVSGFTLQADVLFTAGNVLAGSSTMTVSPGTIAAGGSTATITVTLKDATGNPVGGEAVSVGANGTGNTLTPTVGSTDMNGVFTATISSTKAEMKTVTATLSTFVLNQPLTVNPGPANAAQSTVTASPTSGLPANNASSSTITVTVRDLNGNLISGSAVSVSASGGGTTFTPASGSADSSGVFTSALKASTSGSKQITAVADGVTLNAMPMVAFAACTSPTALTINAAPMPGNTASGTNLYHPVCATPSDALESVYGFTLGSASSVVIDRSLSSYAAITDLRAGSVCTTDSASLGCTAGRYLYCPSLIAGSYELVIDGIAGATGSFDVGVTTGAAKASTSYGVVTLPASFTSVVGAATDIIPIPAHQTTTSDTTTSLTATTMLPFAFPYFGTTYPAGTMLTVFESGYFSFGASTPNTLQNVCLPTSSVPNETIIPFWGRLASRSIDVTATPRGHVLVATQGTAPNRTFTIEWNQFDGVTSDLMKYECVVVSFQAILFEANGQIEFHYQPVKENTCGVGSCSPPSGCTLDTANPNFSVGASATIGLRSGSTTVLTEQTDCNGTQTIGSCAPVALNNACTANKAFLFVPKNPLCP